MNGLQRAALACLVGGVAALAYAASLGELRLGLFLIVPFAIGTGPWALLGMLLLFAAMALWFVGAARGPLPGLDDAENGARTERRSGGVVLLGPIPIVWGSDRRILPWMVAAGLALLVVAFLLTRAAR